MIALTSGFLSRRRFLQLSGFLLTAPGITLAGAQGGPVQPRARSDGLIGVELFRPFPGAQFCAVSPGGTHICLYSFRHLETFLRAWSYDGGATKKTDDALRVVELATGRSVYATQLRSMAVSTSFFARGEKMYVETMPLVEAEGGRASVFQQAVIDLRTRILEERIGRLGTAYSALNWPYVLGLESALDAYVSATPAPPAFLGFCF